MRAGPDGVPGIPGAAGQDDRLLMVPGPAGAVRVLVADDQKEVRDGLCLLLGLLPGIEVIGAAIDGTDAARQAVAPGPTSSHGPQHAELRRGRGHPPDRAPAALYPCRGADRVLRRRLSLRRSPGGARGFLTKNASTGEILQAISAVCAGICSAGSIGSGPSPR